jgi:hypothetical protein
MVTINLSSPRRHFILDWDGAGLFVRVPYAGQLHWVPGHRWFYADSWATLKATGEV